MQIAPFSFKTNVPPGFQKISALNEIKLNHPGRGPIQGPIFVGP